jgi:hypothetical protein
MEAQRGIPIAWSSFKLAYVSYSLLTLHIRKQSAVCFAGVQGPSTAVSRNEFFLGNFRCKTGSQPINATLSP